MAAGVNDFGVRQHQVDEPYVAEVVGHLVDEEGRLLAVDAGVLDEVLAEAGEVRRLELWQHSRILAGGADFLPPAQAARQRQDVGQLQGAIHLAVGGQNLFQEGGAGARQAQDENGVRRRVPPALALFEEGGIADGNLLVKFAADGVACVAALRLLQLVALGIVVEGGFIVPLILCRLALGKGQIDPVHVGKAGAGRLLLHGGRFVRSELVGLEVGKGIVGLAMAWLAGERALVGGHSAAEVPQGLAGMALGGQGAGVAGQAFQHLAEHGQRLLEVP